MTQISDPAQIRMMIDMLDSLQQRVEERGVKETFAKQTLLNTCIVLNNLDQFAIRSVPTEPEESAAEVDLEQMYDVSNMDSVEQALMWAALQYARQRPEWFATWHTYTHPDVALQAAADKARRAHNKPAQSVLRAASEVLASNPYLHAVNRQDEKSAEK